MRFAAGLGAARAAAALALLMLGGCEQVMPDISWERMIHQHRGAAYRANQYFSDGKLMQQPPLGTVPVERVLGPQPLREGMQGEDYAQSIPVEVDHALMARGRERFELICATCHGVDGSGHSVVAQNMELRKPPALTQSPVREYPVGKVFQVITEGYGLMPSFAAVLPIPDRWAVVAYVRALQRSQGSELASLPQGVRERAQEQLK